MAPPRIPKPLHIFHITAIANLSTIVERGALESKTLLAAGGVTYSNIAYQGAQGKRARKKVVKPPGGTIHDYVPFYFAPRSPMLYTINQGNMDGCPHRQPDIVHLVTTVEAVSEAGLRFVFYNYNATLDFADCFNDLDELDQIDWPLFFDEPKIDGFCKFFHNVRDKPKYAQRMETRQAEFLVHETVPLSLLEGIGVCNEAKAEEVREILGDLQLPVRARPGWYF
jgi:hypothetical protein